LFRHNCAAIADSLLESELFGHERGAFTGATQTKVGLLEAADGGTFFFDEIGEMSAAMQAKLLRVIEERQVYRLGAVKSRAIDVRFIAATHRDLEAEAIAGRFRSDLLFRLNGIAILLPPLRERLGEIEGLAELFCAEFAKRLGHKRPPQLSKDALALLRTYHWPGNIRELRNFMERAVLLCSDGVITPRDLPAEKMRRPPLAAAPAPTGSATTRLQREDLPTIIDGELSERDRITAALAESAGNQTRAAQLLGISRRTLVSRLEQYDLPRPRKR
jgi:transcriptional regulator with PAS, ATPase and Fis domain